LFVFIAPPHAVPQAAAVLSGWQQAPLTQTAEADAQLGDPPEPQNTVCPQLFFAEPQT